MAPARLGRQLTSLGSLQLIRYANNPTKVITELAFITGTHVNNALTDGSDVDAPLEVQFDEFLDGVNSRGKGTKARQRKMTVEQAAAVLLVQKGHVELIAKGDDPQTIDVIRILPEAKRMLATFLPKLRAYGDIPYDKQYRGAIALAKRHFFQKGQPPTKKELMALLLRSYQERRRLSLRCQPQLQSTKTSGVQTSLRSVNRLSYIETASGRSAQYIRPVANSSSTVDIFSSEKDNVVTVAIEPTLVTSNGSDPESDSIISEHEAIQMAACTPVAPKSFNPYMTPVSNPRRGDLTMDTPIFPQAPPMPTVSSDTAAASEGDSLTHEGIGEMLQTTATTQGRLNYYYSKFVAVCKKITLLEGQKEEMQREFDLTKKQLNETEQRLREANINNGRLQKWVDTLLCRVDTICGQLGLLREMKCPEIVDGEE